MIMQFESDTIMVFGTASEEQMKAFADEVKAQVLTVYS
jgi:hypothetical protein